ncbi:MAG: YbjN domain-containing protein [Armatimonadota bacterium]|nr:YbjN domain-containing protein [Armatimonadota bacterium]
MLRNKSVIAGSLTALMLLPTLTLSPTLAAPKPAKTPTKTPPKSAAKPDAAATRLLAALKKSGYKYVKAGEGIWIIPLEGKNLKEITVIASGTQGYVLLQAELAERKNLTLDDALLLKMLQLNDEFDMAKIALADDRLYVRTEIHARFIDTQELKFLVSQVGSLADEAYPHVKKAISQKEP